MATPEYAESTYNQIQPNHNPQPLQEPKSPEIVRPKQKTRVVTKKEMITMTLMGISAIILVFSSLITQVMISNQNRSFQDLQNTNVAVSTENNNLSQEVQELSRYNRIMEIAQELGLEMNETNIRNVIE
ncbi:cell division protein FtsL [Jeotgalibaca ciconiae]|uniref:Cell division protein FtsL n=1 Tax=Jeotgalibaca ciconiae TaxID=2496265 RepID=A0A3S9HCI9_9LACT|nr:cell division protein FtsL [Jeotgalibaca ciconiae]AZP05088.1 cell division protein FtsL [Jeotgalibaca ciconiae]HJB23225.1 cell division protein FtsL [Candidatus Jeotgalibaca pullicola]